MSQPAAAPLSPEGLSLVAELSELVRVVALRNDLWVRVGREGCAWSFNFISGAVTVNPQDLVTRSADFCRGLIVHEAAHATVTVLHRIVPRELLARRRYRALLNVVEDMRIETWMVTRLPGTRPWMNEYNDALFGEMINQPSGRSKVGQFFCGALTRWWFGADPPDLDPQVARALDAVGPALEAAVAAQPPRLRVGAGLVSQRYGDSAVARAFLLEDTFWPPSGFDMLCRLTQFRMWTIVWRDIVPVLDALAEADRRDGIAEDNLLDNLCFVGDRHVGGGVAGDGSGGDGDGDGIGRSTGDGAGRGAGVGDAVARALAPDPSDRYLAAWQRLHAEIDHLAEQLLERLQTRNRGRLTSGHPTGVRLDLRAAMRFEADLRQYRTLWLRKVPPDRIDPCFTLLIDCSGSMSGDRMTAAFDGVVLVCEVCARVGIPLELWTFSDSASHVLAWDAGLGAEVRRRLGSLHDSCDGGTQMEIALDRVRARSAELPYRDQALIVISDGEPADVDATRQSVRALEKNGVACVGLGIGQETSGMTGLFQDAIAGCDVTVVAHRLADIVARRMGL